MKSFRKLKKVSKLLIEAGANINARTGKHESPLHYALERGEHDLEQLLKDNGGVVNIDGEELFCYKALEADYGSSKVYM